MNDQLDYLTRCFGDPLSEAVRERVQHPDITQRKDIALKCLRAYDKQQQWLAKQIAKAIKMEWRRDNNASN